MIVRRIACFKLPGGHFAVVGICRTHALERGNVMRTWLAIFWPASSKVEEVSRN
jgi:hypothetical protein